MKIQTEVEVEIPTIPNFIMQKGILDRKISIAELSQKELQEIGRLWTDKLIQRSIEIRTKK